MLQGFLSLKSKEITSRCDNVFQKENIWFTQREEGGQEKARATSTLGPKTTDPRSKYKG